MKRARRAGPITKPAGAAPPSLSNTLWKWRAGLCVITLAVYANALGCDLALDGPWLVRGDSRIRAVSAENLGLIWSKPYWWPSYADWLYRPVTTTSFLVNYTLGGGNDAFGYHAVNLALHLANVLLVFALARRLFPNALPAFLAAALWAVHPIGVETVTNIAGRADLLSVLAVLTGLLLYTRSSVPRTEALFGVALFGLLSKENAAVLAGLMLLWDLAFRNDGRKGFVQRLPAYAAVAGALVLWEALRLWIFHTAPWPQTTFVENPLREAGFWTARLTAVKVVGLDLLLLLFPLRLASDRSFNEIPVASWHDPAVWLALCVVAALLILAFARRRKDPLMFWAAGFFGIALLPTSNLVVQIGAVMAERFLYLPAIAFAITAAALASRLLPRRYVVPILGLAIALSGIRTFARNPDWSSHLALMTADVKNAPSSVRLHEMRGEALFLADRTANLDEAIRELETAWAMIRDLPPGRMLAMIPASLGTCYDAKGDAAGTKTPEGRAWYEKALPLLLRAREASELADKTFDELQLRHGKPLVPRPGYQPLYFALGGTYARLGRYPEAVDAYRYGIGLKPEAPDFYMNLARAYFASGDTRSAVTAVVAKAALAGFNKATLGEVQKAYENVPDGACAVTASGDLNLKCPRLRSDLCTAYRDLRGYFLAARDPARARSLRDEAVKKYGCPAF
ncbi:MAG TPA: tetratricopeptide repeat protein [Bryobacteraceae bacterium]